MQSIIGLALLGAVVLAVMALRPRASGAVPRFMSYPAMDEIVALVLAVTAAFGILLTGDSFTSLY
jgi:hypothetical protein